MDSTGGWNRSSADQPVKKGGAKAPSAMRGIVAGVVVCALAVAAYFLLFPGDQAKRPVREDTKKGLIKEVTPAAAPKAEPEKDDKPKLTSTQVMGRRGIPIETHGLKTYWDHGVLRYEGGLRVLDPNRPSAKPFVPKSYSIFKRSSLDSIASLINLRPGDFISGDVEYGDEFIKDFNDSLAEEIKYEEGDSDYVKSMKDAVKDVKKQLYEKMNAGENIADIMNETRQDLRNMFLYRKEILAMVSETADKEDTSDADAEDLIKAANMMFREKGVREIEEGEILRWNLILEAKRQNGESTNEGSAENE